MDLRRILSRISLLFHSQGHLLELKLAAIQSLPYSDFFNLFGNGIHPNFRAILDSRIAPFISSIAYQFWRVNENAFSSAFYLNGYSGWALSLAQIIFSLARVTKDAEAICRADSVAEQEKIWNEKLNPIVVALLKNPVFCWNALGVPLNQRRMLLSEGTIYDFLKDTLDPLASAYSFKNGAYFYLLVSGYDVLRGRNWTGFVLQALLGHYTPESCPAYLTREGFKALKRNDGEAMDAFSLHTDSVLK
jgi:betaine lipid synthase